MIDLNQEVEIRWNNFIKKHYIDKGYVFTKQNDFFKVKINDLANTSNAKIKVICDYCGEEKIISYKDYNKNTKNQTLKYACKHCKPIKQRELSPPDNSKYYNLFLEKCKENNCTPVSKLEDYKNAHQKLRFICPKHGLQEITYASIYCGCWCNLCGFEKGADKLRRNTEDLLNLVKSKNNNILLNPEDYINSSTSNLKIKCGSCGKEFITSLNSLINSNGACLDCSHKKTGLGLVLTPNEVKQRIEARGNTILNPEDYIKNNALNLKIKCKECGNVYITSLTNFELGAGLCLDCLKKKWSKDHMLSPETIEQVIASKNNNKIVDVSQYKGNTSRIQVKCGTCGEIFETSLSAYQKNVSGKCRKCQAKDHSFGEYIIAMVLDKYNVTYIKQKTFDGCRDKRCLPFDFYLPDYNICIEFDGEQHFHPCHYFGIESFYSTKSHDVMKTQYCELNNIKLIRIPYYEIQNIEKILLEELKVKNNLIA